MPVPEDGSWKARWMCCLTVDLSHLLVMDAALFPIEQRYREGDHIPSSKDVWDVGLHVLMGQKAVSVMVRGEG